MPIETRSKRLGAYDVTVTQFSATRALTLAAKLGRLLGPAIGAIAPLLAGGVDELGKRDVSDLSPALAAAFAAMEDGAVDALVAEVLAGTSVIVADADGRSVKTDLTSRAMIDRAFGADLGGLLAAVGFALEVNYRDFFVGLGGRLGGQPRAPQS